MLKKQYFLKYLNVASFDVEPLPLFLQTLTQAFFFSFFFLIPQLKYMYTYFYAEIFSLSFFPPSQFSYSPYALHFPLVQGCVISLSSRVLTGTLSARFFSHCDIIQPSLELGWPPWCSFCDYTNLTHTDRREVKVWSSMDSGARLPRCEPCP